MWHTIGRGLEIISPYKTWGMEGFIKMSRDILHFSSVIPLPKAEGGGMGLYHIG